MLRRIAVTVSLITAACGEVDDTSSPTTTPGYRGFHVQTLLVGASDNAEVIKALPGTRRAVLVASKARKVSLLEAGETELAVLRSRSLFDADASESELTHIAFGGDGAWAVLTRTLVDRDGSGVAAGCRGELVFVDVSDSDAFGDVLAQVVVGPMPDAVDVAPDGRTVVSANERDVAWGGKCDGVAGLAPPSVSIVDVSDGPAAAQESKRILMTGGADREPEHVAFARDGDLVAVTLQDSHELALFRVSAVLALSAPTDADLKIVAVPQDSLGRDPWPDGVTRIAQGAGVDGFAVADEASDAITLFDEQGAVLANIEVQETDLPPDFPRASESGWAVYRPDSIAGFAWKGRSYVAASLKYSGAVGVWDVTDPRAARITSAIKVGHADAPSPDEGSSVSPEGITASSEYGFILTANEGESSVSLILPEP